MERAKAVTLSAPVRCLHFVLPENLDPIQLSDDYHWRTEDDLRSGHDYFSAFMNDLPLLIMAVMPTSPFRNQTSRSRERESDRHDEKQIFHMLLFS